MKEWLLLQVVIVVATLLCALMMYYVYGEDRKAFYAGLILFGIICFAWGNFVFLVTLR